MVSASSDSVKPSSGEQSCSFASGEGEAEGIVVSVGSWVGGMVTVRVGAGASDFGAGSGVTVRGALAVHAESKTEKQARNTFILGGKCLAVIMELPRIYLEGAFAS